MAADYSGLTRNPWPGTWSSNGTYPIVLDTEVRGTLQYTSGSVGDRLTDVAGQRLQEGMLVYVKTGYTAGAVTRASETFYQYKLLAGQSRNPATGAMPNAEDNWTKFETGITGVVPISLGGTNATTAAGALTNLGGTTVGQSLFTLTNPSAVTFPRFNADNTVSALNVTAFQTAIGASATATGNTLVLRDSAGSFLATNGGFSGQIATTRTWDGANNKGQILLTGLTGNRIDYTALGFGAPSFTTRSVGTKIAFRQSLSASAVDYAVGLTSSSLWHSVPTSSETFDWYFGETIRAQLSNTTLIAPSFTRNGGSSAEFLKGDGSVDTTTYQPYDADLATIAGFTPTSNNFIVGNGTSWTLQTPAQARASLGGTTVGQNLLTLTNPSAVTFPRINADNTVSTLNATAFLSALGGVVTSVNLTVPTGLTVSGAPITSNGTIAISLASGYSIPTTTSQSTWDAKVTNVTAATPIFMTGNTTNPVVNLAGGYGDTKNPYGIKPANFFLAGSDGASPPAFRAILAADIPQLNQNTTGTAGNVTGVVAVANGGTGANTTAAARTSLGLVIGTDVQAYDADLAAIAALSPTADNFIVGNGTAWTLETPAQTRISLGGTTIGQSLFTLTDPSAVTFPRFNANNTVSALNASDTRTAIGAGTVNSVGGTGTVSGLTLTGNVTNAGNLTLGGTLAVLPSNFANQTANTVLAAPNGASGAPTFRALVAADIPTLNQNTTGTAANVTGIVAVANGGTGANSTSAARTSLGAFGGVSTDLNTGSSDFAWTHTNLPDTSTDFNSLQTTNAYSRLGSLLGSTNGPFGNQWYSIANMQHRGGAGPDGSLWGSVLAIGLTANQTRAAFRTKSSPNSITTYSEWREIITTTTGTGTSNTIPKFTGAGAITNGSVTDDGTTVKATAGRLVFATSGTDRGTIRTTTNEIAIESQGAIHFNYYGGGFGGAQSGRAPVYFWKGSNYGSTTVPTEAFHIEGVAGQSRCYGNFLANTFQSTGTWDAANTAGQIYLNGLTGNRIEFNTIGQGFPTFATRSTGTKIVLHPNIGASLTDYAIGFVADGTNYGMWNSVPASGANFYWYAGISTVATLTGSGGFTSGTITAGGAQLSRIWAGFPLNGTGTARINVNSFGSNFIDFHYLGSATASGQIYYNTATATTVYATTSDYRLKTDIKHIDNAIEKILALKPCNFRMKGAEESVDGFIAHEVKEVVNYAAFGEKDAVKEDGEIIPQTMDMSKLVPLLTAALQDALKRIENLEKIIADKQGEEHG